MLQGTEDALLFESDDNAGKGHNMRVDDLKGLISAGGTKVELVYLALRAVGFIGFCMCATLH